MKKRNLIISLVCIIIFAIIGSFILIQCKKDYKVNLKQQVEINNFTNNNVESEKIMHLYIKVNKKTLIVNLENNSSVDVLVQKLKEKDIIINMEDYANFEKVGELDFELPRNDKHITTEVGDIILYQGNKITIYYDTNSWNFTRLGKIENITQKELKEILGNGNVTVTLSLSK